MSNIENVISPHNYHPSFAVQNVHCLVAASAIFRLRIIGLITDLCRIKTRENMEYQFVSSMYSIESNVHTVKIISGTVLFVIYFSVILSATLRGPGGFDLGKVSVVSVF